MQQCAAVYRQFFRTAENAMAFQAVPNCVSAEVIWNNGLNIVENTFYFRKIAPPYALADLTTLGTTFAGWVHASMKPLVVTSYIYLRTEVRGLNTENDFLVTNAVNTGAGTRVGTANPPQTALSIARKSILTGRSARGRIYTFGHAGADGADGDRGGFSAAYSAAWVAALGVLNNSAFTAGWQPVIVSRFALGVKRLVGVTFDIASWVAVDNRVDTRRDRE
jgi:hypothetical protein